MYATGHSATYAREIEMQDESGNREFDNVFDILSDDAIIELAMRLDPIDLVAFNSTNRRIAEICRREYVWTQLVKRRTGVDVDTKSEAIRTILQRNMQEQSQSTEGHVQRRVMRCLVSSALYTRDGLNTLALDVFSILFALCGFILLQLRLDGIIGIGYWLIMLFFLPIVLAHSLVPCYNVIIRRRTGRTRPNVSWYSSPLQTLRYIYYNSPRGIDTLNYLFLVCQYWLLFGIALGSTTLPWAIVTVAWLVLWQVSGFIVCTDGRVQPKALRAIFSVPFSFIAIAGVILLELKMEDVIDVSYHTVFAPFYLFFVALFVYPIISFMFFCISCTIGSCDCEYGCWQDLCCFDVQSVESGTLKSLILLLVTCIFSPFMITFLALCATLFNGTDDIYFIEIFIPLDMLVVAILILIMVSKKMEYSYVDKYM